MKKNLIVALVMFSIISCKKTSVVPDPNPGPGNEQFTCKTFDITTQSGLNVFNATTAATIDAITRQTDGTKTTLGTSVPKVQNLNTNRPLLSTSQFCVMDKAYNKDKDAIEAGAKIVDLLWKTQKDGLGNYGMRILKDYYPNSVTNYTSYEIFPDPTGRSFVIGIATVELRSDGNTYRDGIVVVQYTTNAAGGRISTETKVGELTETQLKRFRLTEEDRVW